MDLVLRHLNSLSCHIRRNVGSVLLTPETSPMNLQISPFPFSSLSNGMCDPQSRRKYSPSHSSAKQTKLYQLHVVSFFKPNGGLGVWTICKGTQSQERMDSEHLASGAAQRVLVLL